MDVVKRNVYKLVDIAVKNYDSFFRMRQNILHFISLKEQ